MPTILPKPDAQRVAELLDELAELGWQPGPRAAVVAPSVTTPLVVEDEPDFLPVCAIAERYGKTADAVYKAASRRKLGRSFTDAGEWHIDRRAAERFWRRRAVQ